MENGLETGLESVCQTETISQGGINSRFGSINERVEQTVLVFESIIGAALLASIGMDVM